MSAGAGCQATIAGHCTSANPFLVALGLALIVVAVLLFDRWRLSEQTDRGQLTTPPIFVLALVVVLIIMLHEGVLL